MKSAIRWITALAATTTATVGLLGVLPARATSPFGQLEVEQSHFIAVASPSQGGTNHQLLILEQVSNARPCWNEAGSVPTQVDPLLLQFDFSGICGRSTDSNGYSIRVNGDDLGLKYSLRIVQRGGDMLLIGAGRDRSTPEILVGRTGGTTTDFAKITLNPGWRFTRRLYGDRPLGHVYLTYDGDTAAIYNTTGAIASGNTNSGSGSTTSSNPTSTPDVGVAINAAPPGSTAAATRFRDASNDIYVAEINQAVTTGFISGFEDGSFRPRESLTREQLVSMVLGAIDSLPNANLSIPTQVNGNPYGDVDSSRWSASKIQFARDNQIITGYEDGLFRPTQPVTRAELMAVLRRAGEYAQRLQNQQAELRGQQPVHAFSDTNNHWASGLISQMSAFCGVASPLNESGNAFAPDSAAQRNYAAAATLRLLGCVGGSAQTARTP